MAIIVGDIHGDVEKVKSFLAYKPYTLHISLGDYFDSFKEPLSRQFECLQLLIDSDAIILLGNHDVHYLRRPLFRFPGFQQDHSKAIQEFLEANLGRFKVAYAVDGWLCTHAGLDSKFTEYCNETSVLSAALNRAWLTFLADRKTGFAYQSIFVFNYRIYVEGNLLADNIHQVFGHIEHSAPIRESHFIALDTTNSLDELCWMFDTESNDLIAKKITRNA